MSHPAAPSDDLTLALTAALRSALAALPQLVLDPDQVAARWAAP